MHENHAAKIWRTARREFDYSRRTLIMGVLNATPDSFSDGGKFAAVDRALRRAETLIRDGADILDIGGESTRPNSARVAEDEEISRVAPVIHEIAKRFDIAVSIDTTKSTVARAAIEAGAEIVNDVSGLNWDAQIARVAAESNAGLILMHLRGTFETMHRQEFVEQILPEVTNGLRRSVQKAVDANVETSRIALDVGIGFGKSHSQNLELIADLDRIRCDLSCFPVLVGASRKSFIGKITDEPVAANRLHGTTAAHAVAIFNGANIVRVHDAKPAVEAARVAEALRNAKQI